MNECNIWPKMNNNKTRKVQGNDSFQRINFLYQISKNIAECSPALSSYYGNLIVNIAKKNVLKLNPDLKRQMCKKCKCMLIDKVNGRLKIKTRKKSKLLVWSCYTCHMKKEIPINKDGNHSLWVENPEAVIETIHR